MLRYMVGLLTVYVNTEWTNPYYEVYICENEPNTTDYGKNMEDAQVDATTGQVIGEKEIP